MSCEFEWLKSALLQLSTDREDTVIKTGNNFVQPISAGGRYQYYIRSMPEFIISSRVSGTVTCELDDLCKELAKIAYCEKFIKEQVIMEGSIFTPSDVFHPEGKSYWLFNVGELAADFTATIYRYQSDPPMPENWLYSRVARLKNVGVYAYIVGGFGSRRHPRSVIRVKIVKQIKIKKPEKTTAITQSPEVIEEKIRVEAIESKTEIVKEDEIAARIKTLIENI